MVSLPAGEALIDMKRLAVIELEAMGSYAYDYEFVEAHRLVVNRELKLSDLVTGAYRLEEAAKAFAAANGAGTHLKVQLVN